MSSFTRNTRGANFARRSRALGAGLALTLASGAVLADGAQRFVFTAYTDAAGGADVMAGRYRAALEELRSQSSDMDLDPSAYATNRCVAYSMTLQWQEARAACDDAVHMARDNDDSLAVAYANRAVLRWLWSDAAAARHDLAKARELSPRADFVAQNLAALEVRADAAKAHGEMTRTAAATPKS